MFVISWIESLNCWGLFEYDKNLDKVGDVELYLTKQETIKNARAAAGGCQPIRVFNKRGELVRIINKATV